MLFSRGKAINIVISTALNCTFRSLLTGSDYVIPRLSGSGTRVRNIASVAHRIVVGPTWVEWITLTQDRLQID